MGLGIDMPAFYSTVSVGYWQEQRGDCGASHRDASLPEFLCLGWIPSMACAKMR
jgi:hypothetical protein